MRQLILISVLLCSFSYGSELYFSGYVYNQSEIPLEGANILVVDSRGLQSGTFSDREGFFKIALLSDADYLVTVSFIGYNDYFKSISLNNQDYVETIILEMKSIPLDQLEIINSANQKLMTGASTTIGAETISLIKPTGTQEMLEYIPGMVLSPFINN